MTWTGSNHGTLLSAMHFPESHVSTPAILLRRTEYGDYDLIVTFLTLSMGKISLIAKSAKKSTRRFAGVLELFSELDIVAAAARKHGMPVLSEAALRQPFRQIRVAPTRMAYASYWVEIISVWMEDYVEQAELYHLLRHCLNELNQARLPEATLSIVFQMRFLRLSGHSPNLERCVVCQRPMDAIRPDAVEVDVVKGGITCLGCVSGDAESHRLTKGSVKQLLWVARGDLFRAARVKFSPAAETESLEFLERFVPYHLGRQLRSLNVLRQLRGKLA